MKIALFGYGNMGKLIASMANNQKMEIVAICSKTTNLPQTKRDAIKNCDVIIDFSSPECAIDHIMFALDLEKPIVIGTTGWEDKIESIKMEILRREGSCLYSPNFAIGVHLFLRMATYAAKLLSPFAEYDASGIEWHHKRKKDAPSGTAKMIQKAIKIMNPTMEEIPFSSVRCGEIIGKHSLIWDSPTDFIELTHEAKNRESFASGALKAAKWIVGKKGFFTIDDMINEIMRGQ